MRQVGAREYKFDIETGLATYLPREEEAIDLEAVGNAVDQAGFELLGVELQVRGHVSRTTDRDGAERVALTVPSTGQRFLLLPGESDEERRGYARLSEWIDEPERVIVVRGRAHAHEGAAPALTVWVFQVL